MMMQALTEANETIKSKKLELASKEYIASMQTQANLAIALEKVNAQLAETRLTAEMGRIGSILEMNNQRVMDELTDLRQAAIEKERAEHEAELMPEPPPATE